MRFGRSRYPYYICAPDIRDTSGGVTALHYLCHALNSSGEAAYLTPATRSKPGLNVRFLSRTVRWWHRLSGMMPIVVYPETVSDNPLDGTAIVRYLLNRDGALTGRKIQRQGAELAFYYSPEFIPEDAVAPEILMIPVIDDSLFSPPAAPAERSGSYLLIARTDRADIDFARLPSDIQILDMKNPRTLPELASLLQRASVLYSHEFSGTCYCAMLAGCPVLYVRNPALTEIPGQPFFSTDGAAFLDEAGGLERARATVANVRAHWQRQKDRLPAQLENFIRKTQAFAERMRMDTTPLLPAAQLEPGPQEGSWRSTGDDPHFIAKQVLPAGLAHLHLRMTSEVQSQVELYLDSGDGFAPAGREAVREIHDTLEIDRYLTLAKPVRALRFDPLSRPGSFQIQAFSLRPVSALRMYLRLFGLAWHQIGITGNFRSSFLEAMRMLLRGDFSAIGNRLMMRLSGRSVENAYDYRAWRSRHAITAADRQRMRDELTAMSFRPRFSILMPVYNVPEKYLRLAIESVLNQSYPHWELCIADDCSPAGHVRPVLEQYAARDSRIKVVFRAQNGNISAASNSALALATGEFIALLDNDDELTEHALHRMALAIVADPGVDMLYSDEDKVDLRGEHLEHYFKPDWSPEHFLACMYTCHFGVYRAQLIRDVGGFRSEYDGAQDFDLALRVVSRTSRIRHVPDVLYHWRMLPSSAASGIEAKPKAPDASRRALVNHLERMGRAGSVEPGPSIGTHRVRFALIGRPLVSIIISSRTGREPGTSAPGGRLLACIDSIFSLSSYRDFQVVVSSSGALPPALENELGKRGVGLRAFAASDNPASMLNAAAAQSSGSQLLFLDDSVEVRSPDWLESMLEFSQQDAIGAVGAKLLFPDGSLKHVGFIVEEGVLSRPYYGHDGADAGYHQSNLLHRNCSAVSGECMMTQSGLFRAAGGFDETLGSRYHDVDYCLRMASHGKRVVFTPYAELYSHPRTDEPELDPAALTSFRQRWSKQYQRDPFFNPNLSLNGTEYRVRGG